MENKKDLSIIIPHYNSIDLLKILLNSIPKKENIQIIVIDDKSTEVGYKELSINKSYKHVQFLMNKTEKKRSWGL
jgi:glycosyltransferase involved in cell wall biosynthesis